MSSVVLSFNVFCISYAGLSKLDLSCSPDDLTVYLEDGTEIDENDIYSMLPDGTVLFLCQEGENPSQPVCSYFDMFQHKSI